MPSSENDIKLPPGIHQPLTLQRKAKAQTVENVEPTPAMRRRSERPPFKTDAAYRPVDGSVGKVRHLLICMYGGNNKQVRNAYNKIYIDLIFKLFRPFRFDKDTKEDLTISVMVHNDRNIILTDDINQFNEQKTAEEGASPVTPNDYINKVLESIFYLAQIQERDMGHLPTNLTTLPITRDGVTFWIQDYFIALQTNDIGSSLQLIDTQNLRYEKEISELEIRSIKKGPSLTGGNILFFTSDPDPQNHYALVGMDNVFKSVKEADQASFDNKKEQHIKTFKAFFTQLTNIPEGNIILIENLLEDPAPNKLPEGQQELWLGTKQPVYHLDLFMTPAGLDESGRYQLIIGEPVFDDPFYFPLFYWTKRSVDAIVDDLNTHYTGLFTIYRNPLPLTYVDEKKEDGRFERSWFFASLNNCIVQYTSDKHNRYVWMPKYSSDYSDEIINLQENGNPEFAGDWSYLWQYEQETKMLWESLGFRVIKLTNYLSLAMLRGAVRCITKVLYRNVN